MVIGQMASGLGAVPTMGSLKYNREAGLRGIQWPEQEFFTTGGGGQVGNRRSSSFTVVMCLISIINTQHI